MTCLCVFQHSASPPREEEVTAVQPCQIYCIAKFFQESGWRVKLYCSWKDPAVRGCCSGRLLAALLGTAFRGHVLGEHMVRSRPAEGTQSSLSCGI